MNTLKKVLVIAAHPDDEVLGCGGTIAHHTRLGDTVTVLLLNRGIASREKLSPTEVSRQQKELEVRARKANAILGVKELVLLDFPDNAYDSVPLLDIVQAIEKVVQRTRPSRIYTHHWGDVNIDHQITSRAVEAVARPMEDSSIHEVFTFEVPSATEWNFTKERFSPNFFQQLSGKDLSHKIKSLTGPYGPEMRQFPHPRSEEYIKSLASIRGGQSGYKIAEAFQLVYFRNN